MWSDEPVVILTLGNSRKYPYPTTDGFHVLTPPPLAFGNSRMRYFPSCPQNSIIVNPPPLGISGFFWRYIFDLATFIRTNEHEFMPPQGCDLTAPGNKLYSSATRKTYRPRVARQCNPFFKPKFGYKKTPLSVIFLLFVFLGCFDVHKAK